MDWSLVVELVSYCVCVGLAIYLYVGYLYEARWLGASNRAYAVILGTLIVGVSAPLLAAMRDAPLLVSAGLFLGPMFFMAAGSRWVVRHAGGIRPEVELFYAFRRINRIGQGQPAGARKNPGDNDRLLAELEALEQWRSPTTARLIDALDVINRAWVYSPATEPDLVEQWNSELVDAASELWGPGWHRR